MKKIKKIFIICPVRDASKEFITKINLHVASLENGGYEVHVPLRDTDQKAKGIDICKQNATAMFEADEVHIFYSKTSQGVHFDMGVAFALNKPIMVVENEEYGEGKSFPRMLDEWESKWL